MRVKADVFHEKPDEGNVSLSSPCLEFIINFVVWCAFFRGYLRSFQTMFEVFY